MQLKHSTVQTCVTSACVNETFNSYMILNYVIESIYHYHNIHCVIGCQSSIHNAFCVPYLLDQTPWLVLISPFNFVQLLFESGDYSRVEFISLSQSLCWHRKEQSIEWLLDKQGNSLVVVDWFTSLFWVCFTSSRQVLRVHVLLMQVFVMPTTAAIWEWRLFCSPHVHGGAATVQELLIKSGVWLSGYVLNTFGVEYYTNTRIWSDDMSYQLLYLSSQTWWYCHFSSS